MKYPKNHLAQTVIYLCKEKKIEHIVVSPGSRNAPLTLGFTNNSFFECYSLVDERCAAFFALGIAQQKRKPVALVCTSGSALLNYYPAIAEAYFSNIPLVVLSADRPKYLVGIGDGQTINQENVFENHILYNANLVQGSQSQNENSINHAINIAFSKNGPVHINIPFDEPLYEITDKLSVNPKVDEVQVNYNEVESKLFSKLVDQWDNANRKMILVGVNQPNTIDLKLLEEFANDDSVIVLTETTSNIHHEDFFPSIDKIIAPLGEKDFELLTPDILITFGGLIVSKKIKAFLRQFKPNNHWHVDEHIANDTFFCLDYHLKTQPNKFFSNLFDRVTHVSKSDYKNYWTSVKSRRRKLHELYMHTAIFSDLVAFSLILKILPNNTILQLANSATVRYAQLFNIDNTLEVYCNRGTSGIDGSTSTAIGCAVVRKKQTTLITGDLSFFYDSNALWNNYIPNSFRIILINNGGGGIFRILPGQKSTQNFDTYFETKHNLTAKQLCEMYNFDYSSANSTESLSSELVDFYNPSKFPKLLEVFTPSNVNDEVLLNYFEYIK